MNHGRGWAAFPPEKRPPLPARGDTASTVEIDCAVRASTRRAPFASFPLSADSTAVTIPARPDTSTDTPPPGRHLGLALVVIQTDLGVSGSNLLRGSAPEPPLLERRRG